MLLVWTSQLRKVLNSLSEVNHEANISLTRNAWFCIVHPFFLENFKILEKKWNLDSLVSLATRITRSWASNKQNYIPYLGYVGFSSKSLMWVQSYVHLSGTKNTHNLDTWWTSIASVALLLFKLERLSESCKILWFSVAIRQDGLSSRQGRPNSGSLKFP